MKCSEDFDLNTRMEMFAYGTLPNVTVKGCHLTSRITQKQGLEEAKKETLQ